MNQNVHDVHHKLRYVIMSCTSSIYSPLYEAFNFSQDSCSSNRYMAANSVNLFKIQQRSESTERIKARPKTPNFIGKVVGYLQLNVRRDTGSACAQVLILSASPNSVFPHMISVRTANHTLKKDLQLQWDPGLHRLRTGHTCCRSRQIQGHLGQLS